MASYWSTKFQTRTDKCVVKSEERFAYFRTLYNISYYEAFWSFCRVIRKTVQKSFIPLCTKVIPDLLLDLQLRVLFLSFCRLVLEIVWFATDKWFSSLHCTNESRSFCNSVASFCLTTGYETFSNHLHIFDCIIFGKVVFQQIVDHWRDNKEAL